MTTARRFPFSPPSEQELSHLKTLENNHMECSQKLVNARLFNEHDKIKKYEEEREAALTSAVEYRAWLGLPPIAILARESSCAKITKALALYPPLPEQELMRLKTDVVNLESDIQKNILEAKTAITALANDYNTENSVRNSSVTTRTFR